MSTQQVEQRVAHALLRLAKQSGRKVEHGVEIDFPISRQDIAQMTGTTLHTVSRILSGWEQRGLIESGRQRIVLREPHKLFVLAEETPGEGDPPVTPVAPADMPRPAHKVCSVGLHFAVSLGGNLQNVKAILSMATAGRPMSLPPGGLRILDSLQIDRKSKGS